MTDIKRTTKHLDKQRRREGAIARQTERAAREDSAQIALLDRRPGNATRERARLTPATD